MSSDQKLLEAIHEEVVAIKEELEKLNQRIGLLEMILIEEYVSDEELPTFEELTADKHDVIAWAKLKEDLGL